MTAAEWVTLARAVNAPIGIYYHNGRRYLHTPEGWDGLPDLPLELGKEVADILEAEAWNR